LIDNTTFPCGVASARVHRVTVAVAEDLYRRRMNHAHLVRTESRQYALCRRVPVVVVPESAGSRPGASHLRAQRISEVAAVVDVVAAAENPVRFAHRRRGSATRQLILHAGDLLVLRVVHRSPLAQSVAAEASTVDPTTVEGIYMSFSLNFL